MNDEPLAPMGFEDEEQGFQAFAQALAGLDKSSIDTERRLPYNEDTGEFIMGEASTVTSDTVWDVPYIVIDKSYSVSDVNHRVHHGVVVRIETANHNYWTSTPAETLEDNPFFCIKEIEDDGA